MTSRDAVRKKASKCDLTSNQAEAKKYNSDGFVCVPWYFISNESLYTITDSPSSPPPHTP